MKTILLLLATLPVQLSPKEVHCHAHAVYHESRGESIVGQSAVAYVVRNRVVDTRRYPNTYCGVVYQNAQFTDIKKTKIDYTSRGWAQAVEVAALSQIGYVDNPIGMATMYHNPEKAPNPNWDWSKLELVGDIENHRFYIENDLEQLALLFKYEEELNL